MLPDLSVLLRFKSFFPAVVLGVAALVALALIPEFGSDSQAMPQQGGFLFSVQSLTRRHGENQRLS